MIISVGASPSRRIARPIGWVAQVSICRVGRGVSRLLMAEAYHTDRSGTTLDKKNLPVYYCFRRASISPQRQVTHRSSTAAVYTLPAGKEFSVASASTPAGDDAATLRV